MPHLDEGTLHALVDGEIPSTDLAGVRAHLAGCPECQAQLDLARALADEALALVETVEIPSAAGGAAPGRPGRASRFRQLAWAASVVLAAGLGYAGGRERDVAARPADPPTEAPTTALALEEDTTGAAAPVASSPTAPPVEARRQVPPAAATTTARSEEEAAAPPPAAPERRLADNIRLDEVVVTGRAAPAAQGARLRDDAARKVEADVAFEEVSLPEAIRRLGGTLRLIEGLVPERLLAAGDIVRVVYPATDGLIVLEQERRADVVVVTLTGPPSVPPDSLAVLRRRIR
jgi:hypothetical protein